MKHSALLILLTTMFLGCSSRTTPNSDVALFGPDAEGVELRSKPLPYDDVLIMGNLDRVEYKQLADAVYQHRSFLLPSKAGKANGWYTAAIIQVKLTSEGKAQAMTSFTGKLATSGNLIELKKNSGTWKVLTVETWAK